MSKKNGGKHMKNSLTQLLKKIQKEEEVIPISSRRSPNWLQQENHSHQEKRQRRNFLNRGFITNTTHLYNTNSALFC
jgi:hypothetical protein